MSGMQQLYLMRNFIYRKMTLLWDHICSILIVTLLFVGLTWKPWIIPLRSCVGKDLEMISLQCAITLYKIKFTITLFFEFMNSIDTSGKIIFTMSITMSYSSEKTVSFC